MDNTQLAAALFKAFENGDAETARSLCSVDMQAFQNLNPPMDLDTLLEFSSAVKQIVPDFHYADISRSVTSTGFVEEHRVLGTLPDGTKLELAACVVAEVSEGRISRLREYVDTAAAVGLLKALRMAG
jgi:ketosteroid isomerase-like protein